jgi:hypothetical protein
MEIIYHKAGEEMIAEIVSDKIEIHTLGDATDLMANCFYNGADKMIFRKENITEDFFDLKTRLAGEILQKFSNYRCRLAIIGNFDTYTSKSLRDFIYESNKMGRVCFVKNREDAISCLLK